MRYRLPLRASAVRALLRVQHEAITLVVPGSTVCVEGRAYDDAVASVRRSSGTTTRCAGRAGF